MTNLIGFAGKRNNFRNETFERRCGATPRKKRPQKMKTVRFPNKNAPILCHCEERSDAAILKFEAWHPGTKHGSTKQEGSPITKNMRFATSFRFPSLSFKVLFRSAQPLFVPGWQIVSSKIAASGARALLTMTRLIGFAGKRSNFRNETFEKRCGATPRKKRPHKTKNFCFPNKNAPFWCHCEAALRPWQS